MYEKDDCHVGHCRSIRGRAGAATRSSFAQFRNAFHRYFAAAGVDAKKN